MRKNIHLVLLLAVGVIGCPGGVNETPCDTNDYCVETASCVQKSDDTWCTFVDPMNIEIEEWLQASVGNPYQVSVTAVGGFGPYTWEITRGDEEKLEWLTITWDGDGTTAYLVNKDGEYPTKTDVGDIDLTIRLNDASIKGTKKRLDNLGFFLEKTLTIVDAVATPIFDPDPGIYNSDQQVSISCEIADAKIFYTTNGDDPTTSSTEYTTPISVAGDQTSMTIRAISSKDGLANSTIVEGTYTISYDHISVIYHGNGNIGGEVPIDDTDYDQGQQVVVQGKGTLIKTGHEFDLWNTKSDGTGDDYAPGETFNIGEDNVNLYAQWTPNLYTVTFDSQGGSPVDPKIVDYGLTVDAPPDPSRTGFSFEGWYKDAVCSDAWNFDTGIVTADVILYAKWTNITQTETLEGVSFDIKYVPGGTFPTGTDDIGGNETVSNAFWMGETEVTYELWSVVHTWAISNSYTFANLGVQGSGAETTDQHPVTMISWRDAMVWCNAASELAGYAPVYKYAGAVVRDSTDATKCDGVTEDSTAKGFRLPLSMEWECAARYRGTDIVNSVEIGGIRWTKGDSASGATASCEDLEATGSVAWYHENSNSTTHAVKEKTANALGVYDMSGNVHEWCFDDRFSGTYRYVRGGCYGTQACGSSGIQLANEYSWEPHAKGSNGSFRLLRTY